MTRRRIHQTVSVISAHPSRPIIITTNTTNHRRGSTGMRFPSRSPECLRPGSMIDLTADVKISDIKFDYGILDSGDFFIDVI